MTVPVDQIQRVADRKAPGRFAIGVDSLNVESRFLAFLGDVIGRLHADIETAAMNEHGSGRGLRLVHFVRHCRLKRINLAALFGRDARWQLDHKLTVRVQCRIVGRYFTPKAGKALLRCAAKIEIAAAPIEIVIIRVQRPVDLGAGDRAAEEVARADRRGDRIAVDVRVAVGIDTDGVLRFAVFLDLDLVRVLLVAYGGDNFIGS